MSQIPYCNHCYNYLKRRCLPIYGFEELSVLIIRLIYPKDIFFNKLKFRKICSLAHSQKKRRPSALKNKVDRDQRALYTALLIHYLIRAM